jgi:methyl-accepting chemotaxis protein
MASTSEELSSQAEQLQNTIAFFKLEGGSRKEAASFDAKPANRKATPTRPASRTPNKTSTNGKTPAVRQAGVKIELESAAEGDHDAHDKEFERY